MQPATRELKKLLLDPLLLVFGRLATLVGENALSRRLPGQFAGAAPRFLRRAVLSSGFLLGQSLGETSNLWSGSLDSCA